MHLYQSSPLKAEDPSAYASRDQSVANRQALPKRTILF